MSLIEAIHERDKKLEKDAILQTDDTGRDTKSAQSHLRKHEGFENDIVALEAQLQVLIDNSAALQSRCLGENGSILLSSSADGPTGLEYIAGEGRGQEGCPHVK